MSKETVKKSNLMILIKALLASYIITALLLMILSFLLFKMDLSESVVKMGIIFIYIVSSFLGGLIVGKAVGEKKFIWGFLVGALYFLVIIVCSMCLNKGGINTLSSVITVFVMTAFGGTIGGMIS